MTLSFRVQNGFRYLRSYSFWAPLTLESSSEYMAVFASSVKFRRNALAHTVSTGTARIGEEPSLLFGWLTHDIALIIWKPVTFHATVLKLNRIQESFRCKSSLPSSTFRHHHHQFSCTLIAGKLRLLRKFNHVKYRIFTQISAALE